MKQEYINNISILVDASSSISSFKNQIENIVNEQIAFLSQRSKETLQDNRISIYTFSDVVECKIFDKDSTRLPKFEGYNPYGQTALIDATLQAINDLEKLPELYYSYSKLILIITDGQNNINNHLSDKLQSKLKNLPENYTVAVLVPDYNAVTECKRLGFSSGNIKTWDVSSKGVEEVGETLKTVTGAYMRARASGIRGTKSLFTLDSSNLTKSVVKTQLQELPANQYDIFPVRVKQQIKPFVESWTGKQYVTGSAYFELMKKETIQGYKQILVQDKTNGKVYSGLNARKLLGLPDTDVQVDPTSTQYSNHRVLVQSTSSNRNLIPGTQLIVLK